ncbi:PREDICTED: cytochrome c oxidase assembly protein COX15 homolog [Rhagoletis zephyria]|uniref:cytochrome c oxidase assembly protein COX15 homolog n=1 Tax=Rhagoletis zephyria TaxID=28612 RepID=UPI0008115508|nr:PREDICTED: cytochrome c oxidase assembly protein COX15 homolog [Rhagoletis zephyria]XP_036332847.1 cytochrome c oxidase assembly protein COX15 homolog [Rhagoletis pomonella]
MFGCSRILLNKNGIFTAACRSALYRRNHLLNIRFQKDINLNTSIWSIRCNSTQRRGEKIIGAWLLGCSGMVYVAVALGGVTRLTESGLSMVNWKLLGEKKPSNLDEWKAEFHKYQQFPEFKMKNRSMTLEEFKFIYMMEYIHRMWGRGIGAVFAIPAIYFWRRGYFTNATKKYILVLGALIGLQGLMGWFMVKSGLEDKFQDINDVPRVSQYRLASHLGVAFIIYSLFLSSGLRKFMPPANIVTSSKNVFRLKNLAYVTKGLVFLTAISGAFVAGLDAGLVYNSFPKMADKWIPDDILSFEPVQRNFTENPTTVQFDHRILGITTVVAVSLLWMYSKRCILPKRARYAVNTTMAMAWLQATLGVTTLLNHVPAPLATAHQSGSLLLLSLALWLSQELRLLKYIPK